MSRLLIKNLPLNITSAHLKEHLEQKKGPGGTITDVKVAHKRDGTSRRFGFVGYKTEQEAEAAKKWFDQTFLGSSRISVATVEGVKDAPPPRPNKRRRVGPSSNEEESLKVVPKIRGVDNNTSYLKDEKHDARLDEFMEVMKPRTKKGPSWANEESLASSAVVQPSGAKPNVESVMEDKKEDAPHENISDLDWLRKHTSKDVDTVNKVFEQSDDEIDDTTKTESRAELSKDPTKETILQTSRLFLRNLAFTCTDAELLDLFRPFGEVSQVRRFLITCKMKILYRDIRPSLGMLIHWEKPIVDYSDFLSFIVHIPLDPTTKQSKGMAYVSFASPENALAAYEKLDGRSFQGRLLHILAAVNRKGAFQVEEGEGKKQSLKQERNAKRKAIASKEFNWSMLYMNPDAVATSVADRFNIDKSDILNPESGGNPAVKLALAETHIIQETKTYLESQGVLLSSFSARQRSDTIVLVKNIPYGTTLDQIKGLFEPHGETTRILVPPAGTMAVVEFERADEAAKAFRAVAYRRLGNSVVYLEKGPLGMFTEDPTAIKSQSEQHRSTFSVVKVPEQDPIDQEELPSVTGGTTLYVKNLSFATTQQKFEKMFQHLPSFAFARIQTKPDPRHPDGPRMSMGYGFVGFKDVEGANRAVKSMQGFTLDGHALDVKFAGRGTEQDEKGKDGKAGSKNKTAKMIIKNVPFEATKKDIRDLFSSYGHIKSVRLPKKFDSRTRGFAFVEFVSRHEAENAYTALRHTHLLGRHLVLEWVEEAEQDLDALRKKAGVGFGGGKEMPGRKKKLEMELGEEAPDDED